MLHRYLLIRLWLLAACVPLVFAQLQCPSWTGRFRDCTCGVSHRDREVRCCSPDTCQEPLLISQNRSCTPFVCMNGGTFNSNTRECFCQSGFFGLCCERETEFCGGVLFAPFGVLTSPGYPNHYSNRVRCVWKISTDPIRRIALGNAGDMFELEPGTTRYSCNHDWVAVYDGVSPSSRLIGRFCGSTIPTVRSSGRHMRVEFHSDWQQRRKGFQLHYLTFFAVERCGRTNFSRQTGVILSPQYPLAYPPSSRCSYKITLRPGHKLVLSPEEMNIPGGENCRVGDRIIVRRHTFGQAPQPIFVLCGSALFDPIHISNSTAVSLVFRSDCHRAPSPSEGRFKLRFEQIPDSLATLTRDTPTFTT